MRIRFAAIDFVGNDRRGAATASRGTRHNRKPCRPTVSLAGQRHGGFAIEALAAAQEKAQRAAFAVDHRVDFACAAAAACALFGLRNHIAI
jgi:hypothetical protein